MNLPIMVDDQRNKFHTFNEAMLKIDNRFKGGIKSSTPPSIPFTEYYYLVEATATGVFEGREDSIAEYINGAWYFTLPEDNQFFMDKISLKLWQYQSGSWVEVFDYNLSQQTFVSAGVADYNYTYTDNGDGTVTLSEVTVKLFDNPNYLGDLSEYTVSGTTLTVPDGENFICIEYNAGTPQWCIQTDRAGINESDTIPVLTIYMRNNSVYVCHNWDALALGLPNKQHKKDVYIDRYELQEGGAPSINPNREIYVTAGTFWLGGQQIETSDTDSTVDDTELYYYNGTDWVYTVVTQYNNTQYNDRTSGLVTLSDNKYNFTDIYKVVSDGCKQLILVLSPDEYDSESEAFGAAEGTIPDVADYHTERVGRIVTEKGFLGTVKKVVDLNNAFASVTDHQNLTNIKGSVDGYHVSHSNFTSLNDINAQLNQLHTDGSPTFDTVTISNILLTDSINSQNGNGININDENLYNIDFLKLNDQSKTYTTQFLTDTQTANITYTLPSTNGLNGQSLVTDGNGNLDWVTIDGGGTSINISQQTFGNCTCDTGLDLGSTYFASVSFIPNRVYSIETFTVECTQVGTDGNVRMGLYDENHVKLVESSTVTTGLSEGLNTFTLQTPYEVNSNKKYYIAIQGVTNGDKIKANSSLNYNPGSENIENGRYDGSNSTDPDGGMETGPIGYSTTGTVFWVSVNGNS